MLQTILRHGGPGFEFDISHAVRKRTLRTGRVIIFNFVYCKISGFLRGKSPPEVKKEKNKRESKYEME